ncbi:hypothetical protein K9M41_02030 [Candidatus Gracilibacteria bacterium]|nr:hypothetical protein [Candidatus Gracilibacteria bacterium]
MKIFLWLGLILFTSGEVFAFTQAPKLFCPRSISNFHEDDRCNNSFRSYELLASEALKDEADGFQSEVLDIIHQDNGSNPNFIAEKGIYDFRQHEQCLADICEKVFTQCGENLDKSKNYSQDQWCQSKANQISRVSKTKLINIINENQARKERSLLKQKFGTIATRNRFYFHHWLGETVNQFRNFTAKVYNFIQNPN